MRTSHAHQLAVAFISNIIAQNSNISYIPDAFMNIGMYLSVSEDVWKLDLWNTGFYCHGHHCHVKGTFSQAYF